LSIPEWRFLFDGRQRLLPYVSVPTSGITPNQANGRFLPRNLEPPSSPGVRSAALPPIPPFFPPMPLPFMRFSFDVTTRSERGPDIIALSGAFDHPGTFPVGGDSSTGTTSKPGVTIPAANHFFHNASSGTLPGAGFVFLLQVFGTFPAARHLGISLITGCRR